MKITRITAGLALALASTAAMAVSGDRWYGTNRYMTPVPEPVVVTGVEPAREYVYTYPERRVVIERGVLPPDAVIVQRSYEVVPTYPIEKPYDYITELNPQTGPHLDMGLFPRTGEGPTDFGG